MKKLSIIAMLMAVTLLICCPVMVQASADNATQNSLIQKVEYDPEDGEVSFDFSRNVTYSDPAVVITDEAGQQTFETRLVERDRDELTVHVDGLTTGATYKYTITGVVARRGKASEPLTGTFVAVDRD